jgi:hypothetical protein
MISPKAGETATDPLDRVCDALASTEAVLVIDNCEHVLDALAVWVLRRGQAGDAELAD